MEEAEVLFTYVTAKKYVDRERVLEVFCCCSCFNFMTEEGTNRTYLCCEVMYLHNIVLEEHDPVLYKSRVVP